MTVILNVDSKDLKNVKKRLGRFSERAPNAISRALNRTVTNVKANISREVRQDYHVKAKDVRDTLKDFKASRSNLSAEVKSRGQVIGLDHFKVNPKTVYPKRKSQLKIAVKKDGVKQILGAFIANINGNKVFIRDTRKRLPISKMFGPSVPQMISNERVYDSVKDKAVETYEKRLNYEINRILKNV